MAYSPWNTFRSISYQRLDLLAMLTPEIEPEIEVCVK